MIEKFIGTWKLVSFESILATGETVRTYGDSPKGYLIYTKEGYVQVAIMHEQLPQEEARPVSLLDYLSYAGKFEIHAKSVSHHIDVASYPSWTGGTQERAFHFLDENRLLLAATSPITVMGNTFLSNDIVWEKQ